MASFIRADVSLMHCYLRAKNGCLWIGGILLVPHLEEKHFG